MIVKSKTKTLKLKINGRFSNQFKSSDKYPLPNAINAIQKKLNISNGPVNRPHVIHVCLHLCHADNPSMSSILRTGIEEEEGKEGVVGTVSWLIGAQPSSDTAG